MHLHKATYFLLAVGLLWAQLNGTYTIGGAGADYPHITAAINALQAQGASGPVRFEIRSDYTGEPSSTTTINVALTGAYPGMGTHPVTLTVHSSVTTPVTVATAPTTGTTGRFVLRLNGVDNFIIDGGPQRLLRFQNNNPNSGTGVIGLASDNSLASRPCRNIIIRNVEIDGQDKGSTRAGIYLGQVSTFPGAATVAGNNNILIENCWIYSVQEGIILWGPTSTRDQNNEIRGCKIGHPVMLLSWGGATRSSGIVAANQDGLRIEQDTIFNASSGSSYGYTGIAVGYTPQTTTAAPCINTHITRNWVYTIEYTGTVGWNAYGIRVNVGSVAPANVYIYNNFVAGVSADGWQTPASDGNAHGIFLQGSGTNANAGVYVYHNTVHLFGTPPSNSYTNANPACLSIASSITGGVYVRNNVFQNTQSVPSPSTTRTTLGIAYAGTSPSVFAELDNNAYYVNHGDGTQFAFVGALGSTRYATLSAWQSALGGGREQNSVQFSDTIPFVSDVDLHLPLVAAELEIEGGGGFITTPIAITIDIDGDTRPIGTPTGPDMGADEMQVPPCPTAISAGTVSISPASVEAGVQSFTLTASGTVTLPAEWQISINGGPWTTLQLYSSPSINYTPQQVGNYAFRIVARVARYHQTCPGLENDTSNVVSGTATCPANLSVGTISASVTSQPAGNPFVITVTGTVSLPAQWEDSSATSGGWNFVAPYTGSPFNYTIPLPGTRWIRLAALPPSGCSNLPVYSNELELIATATGNTINDPLNITPQDPTRTDTTVNGNNSVSPFTNTYTGPGNQSSPDVFYMYILRECLDSIRVSTCNTTGFGTSNDTYIHVLNISANRTLYADGGRCGATTTILQAALDIFHDPNTTGAQNVFSPYRGGMRLAAGDTLIIVVEGWSTNTGPFVLDVTEYRYDPANQPTLPSPPFFSFDTSRVCWLGGIARDTLSTGINLSGVRHTWYLNGQPVSGVDTSVYVPQFNAPGIYEIVAELRSATTSFCAPASTLPRDTVYVVVDTLPDMQVLVDGSPYDHAQFPEITGSGTICVEYQASAVRPGFTYTWLINGTTYTGPGPHQECYLASQWADTVVLITTNGACVEIDSIYVSFDRVTGLGRTGGAHLSIYPNPVREQVYVRSSESGTAEVRLHDLRGQLLLQQSVELRAGEPQNLRLPALSAGVYLMEVQQSGRVHRERLMIE